VLPSPPLRPGLAHAQAPKQFPYAALHLATLVDLAASGLLGLGLS
jgi:hypothetical protein